MLKSSYRSFFLGALISIFLISCGGGGSSSSSVSSSSVEYSGAESVVETYKYGSSNQSVKLLLVRVTFSSDATYNSFQSNANVWAGKIFGLVPGQLNDYWSEVSSGQFQLTPAEETDENDGGSVNDGVVTVSLPITHPNPAGDGPYHTVLYNALVAADASVDFSSFDSDENNRIEYDELQVMFVWAGWESATGGSPGVWAHAWCLNSGTSEGVSPPTLDGVVVMGCLGYDNGYSVFGEKHKPSGIDATIGIIAHEQGHAIFGLPDLYDTDGSSEGIGSFGLMGSGNWGYALAENQGESPVHLTAWSKLKTGIIQLDSTADASGDIAGYSAVGTSQAGYTVLKMDTKYSGEYFLFENRDDSGYDDGLDSLENLDFTGGLAIWHIDDNVSNNKNESHKLVDIEEAKSPGLDASLNRGLRTNLFYSGNVTGFSDSTSPANSRNYAGSSTGISISNISAGGNTMTFDVAIEE
jgi:M6 family metalloprotease-like protein